MLQSEVISSCFKRAPGTVCQVSRWYPWGLSQRSGRSGALVVESTREHHMHFGEALAGLGGIVGLRG